MGERLVGAVPFARQWDDTLGQLRTLVEHDAP